MDREYLKHIDSSPYVDEGFFDSARASAAGFGQRVKNALPSEDPYNTPQNAKLLSYYKTFIDELKNILDEFSSGPKSPAERLKRGKLSSAQSETIQSLLNLYQILAPSVFPAGTRPEIRGTSINNTVNKLNTSYAKSMKHLANEAWFGRASTRSGGDIDEIINKYINEIKNSYSKFIKNISKFFPGTLQSKLTTSFKEALNDPKISKLLDKIEGVVKTTPPPVVPTTPPAPTSPPSVSPTTTPSGGSGPSNNQKQNANDLATLIAATLNIISARVIEDKNSRPYYSKPLADGNYYLPTSVEEPYPLKHSSEWNPPHLPNEPENLASLPDTSPEKQKYLSDKEEYDKKVSSYKYVPIKNEKGEIVGYTYKLATPAEIGSVPNPVPFKPQIPEPNLNTEATDIDTSSDIPDSDENNKDDENEDIELTGEFLYDFASLYRKHHGKYSIEVTKSPTKVIFDDGRETIIKVFWNWNNHFNTILIQTLNSGKSFETSELLKFYDDEVNPQSPYYASNFNIPHFLEQVNPNARDLYIRADANKQNEVVNATKLFKPAAYAVIRRKGPMEFKSYKSLRFYVPPEWENRKKGDLHWGDVKLLRGKFGKYPRSSIIPFKTIHEYYYTEKNKETQAIFDDALNEADYWNSYVDIKKEFTAPAPVISDDEETDIPNVSDETPDTASTPEVPKEPVIKNKTSTIPDDWKEFENKPNAIDAVSGLINLGYKPIKARSLILKIMNEFGSDKTTEEFIQLVLKQPKTSSLEKTPTPELPKSEPTAPIDNKPVDDNSKTIAPSGSFKSKKEKVLNYLNQILDSLNIEKLDNIEQLSKLDSIKGGYNTSIKNKANLIDDETEKNNLLSRQIKGAPTKETSEIWAKLISQAKKSKPNISEEIINPFQFINFL